MRKLIFFIILMLSIKSLAQTTREFYIVDSISADSMDIYINSEDGHCYVSFLNSQEYYLSGIDFFSSLLSVNYGLYFKLFGYREFDYEFPRPKGSKTKMRRAVYQKNPTKYYQIIVKGEFFNRLIASLDGLDPYKFKDPKAYYIVYVPVW